MAEITHEHELWGAETRKAVDELPGLGRADPGRRGPLAGPDQGRGRARERRPRPARRRHGRRGSPRPPTRSPPATTTTSSRSTSSRPGSGTSSNMNANEVIADPRRRGRAPERPRQHGPVVERRLPVGGAPGRARPHRPRPATRRSTGWPTALAAKAEEFADVVKSGRTHLMDAVPVTLGQEFGGYAAQIREGRARVDGDARAAGQDPARRHRHRHRPEHASRVRRRACASAARRATGLEHPCRRPTRSRRRPTATAWSRRRARCARSPSR